jgi:hypothetical protein
MKARQRQGKGVGGMKQISGLEIKKENQETRVTEHRVQLKEAGNRQCC